MRSSKPIALFVIMFLMSALGVADVAMTGCSSSTRHTSIAVSVDAIDAARAAWESWDVPHQKSLIDASPNEAAADVTIKAYRVQQARVEAAFVSAYRLEALAITKGDDASLQAAIAALSDVKSLLTTLGVHVP